MLWWVCTFRMLYPFWYDSIYCHDVKLQEPKWEQLALTTTRQDYTICNSDKVGTFNIYTPWTWRIMQSNAMTMHAYVQVMFLLIYKISQLSASRWNIECSTAFNAWFKAWLNEVRDPFLVCASWDGNRGRRKINSSQLTFPFLFSESNGTQRKRCI